MVDEGVCVMACSLIFYGITFGGLVKSSYLCPSQTKTMLLMKRLLNILFLTLFTLHTAADEIDFTIVDDAITYFPIYVAQHERKIAEAIESALHTAYSQQRLRGEWFNLTDADVAAIIETLK